MEAVLGQVEQLPALLAVSRSALVRDWDGLTLDRALEWARYFQHLHNRFRARPQLREALGRRLRRSQPCPLLGFPALGRCPQLLGLALLENRALPPAACRRLLRSLLQPPAAGPASDPRGLGLLARRKAAARLLALPRRGPGPEPQLQVEARLLLSRLRQEAGEAAGRLRGAQEGLQAGEAAGRPCGAQEGQLPWLCGALELLPQPRAFGVVAAALVLLKQGHGAEQAGDRDGDGDGDGSSSPGGYQESAAGEECTAGLLLSWLLGNQERFSAFCLCIPCSHLAFLAGHYSQLCRSYLDLLTGWGRCLHYDPLQGQWVRSCLEKAELSWEELREHFICLCQGSTPLKEQTQAALELLRTQDGDFRVRGLSVWTDLLMEIGYSCMDTKATKKLKKSSKSG
ncbi:Fanconi anemia group F protein [Melospiza georgiana]|uniref:Fanconi anemia group F protein n=1 Tax=Melospiza georgiana TaxID=44398 RepID=UPI0025ABF792|nr:Fanconi anemia group F protein [Melospiza georgiana]